MTTYSKKILFFANTDWYLFNFRLGLAKYLRSRGMDVVMVSPYGIYGKKLEEEGFLWIPVNMVRRSLNPFREILLLWQLSRIYKTENPDVVHHFTIKCVVYGGLAARASRIKSVISAVTGLGYVFTGNDFRARALKPFVRELMRYVIDIPRHRLILQNPDDSQTFLSAGLIKNDHIRIIAGSGVNTQRFYPKPANAIESRKITKVVFASRLLWDKGLAEYVEAAQQLYLKGIDAEFIIAGDTDPGNPASISEETLAKWKTIPAIKLVGHVDDMAELLDSADIMVLPSYREGLPRCLIEASAAGVPIITTDAPGCREVVDHGVNGYLIPVRDSEALVEALLKIIKNPDLAAKMSIAGRTKALSEFDEQIVFKKTVDVYGELNPIFLNPLELENKLA